MLSVWGGTRAISGEYALNLEFPPREKELFREKLVDGLPRQTKVLNRQLLL